MTNYMQANWIKASHIGEPDAVKVASPVRRGAVGKVPARVTRWLPTLHLYHLPTAWMDYDASAKQFTDQAKAKLSGIIAQHYTRALGDQTRKRSWAASPPADPQVDQRDGLPDGDQAQPLPAAVSPDAPPQAETSENVRCALSLAALNAKGAVVFAKHWEAAQSWLVERYTAKVTSANIRHRLTELTSDELAALLAGLTTNTRYYGQEWHKHRKAAAKTNQSK